MVKFMQSSTGCGQFHPQDRTTHRTAEQPELFWATIGGMGLTGVILDATITLLRIETSRMSVDTTRIPDLDTLFTVMSEGELHVPRLGRIAAGAGFRLVAAMNPFDAIGTARISSAWAGGNKASIRCCWFSQSRMRGLS